MTYFLNLKNKNIHGLLLSIEFEKAFDTVSWKFISKVPEVLDTVIHEN